jgi:hypothetical protein
VLFQESTSTLGGNMTNDVGLRCVIFLVNFMSFNTNDIGIFIKRQVARKHVFT